MASEDILVETTGAVRTVTLDRGAKRNALTAEMLDEIETIFGSDPGRDERVTVLRANGPVFCAGLDLRAGIAGKGGTGKSTIEPALAAIENYPLPVVAVVQGDAIAGGNELALHCDFVVASTKASFGMSLAQIGLAPTWFLCKKLMEVAGPVTTREILLLGDPVASSRMHELGIIARAVPPHRLETEASLIIDRLAANAPLSLRAMKAMIVREMKFRDDIDHADVDLMVAAAGGSSDAKEGMAARLDRRVPDFSGE